MNLASAPKLPPLYPTLASTSHQCTYFLRSPCPEARGVPVDNQHKRDNRNNIRKEQEPRIPPEVERRYQQQERPHQRTSQKRGDRPVLEFKDSKAIRGIDAVFQYLRRQRIIEMVKGEEEEAENFGTLSFLGDWTEEVARGVGRVDRIVDILQALCRASQLSLLPCLNVRCYVREYEVDRHRLGIAVGMTILARRLGEAETSVQVFLDVWRGTSSAGAEVHECIVTDSCTENTLQRGCDEFAGRAGLDYG